jgi:sulfofructose kinase
MSTHQVELLAIGLASYDVSLFVDEFPRENSKLETHEMIEQGGGPAANAAYLLSMWGVNCGFAGLVGDDIHGRRILDEFNRIGTDLSLIETRGGHATAVSVILVNTRNGSRTIVNKKAPVGTLRLHSSQLQEINPTVLLFDGHELEASLLVLEAFPDAASILDAGSLRAGTEKLAARVKYLVAAERFALQVSGLPDLGSEVAQRECLRRLRGRARADAIIVVTLGSSGLIFEEAGTFHQVSACAVHAIDTTGAGDIFHGAFAYGVLRGLSLQATLELATVAAGLSVQRRGGRHSIPTLAAVEKGSW